MILFDSFRPTSFHRVHLLPSTWHDLYPSCAQLTPLKDIYQFCDDRTYQNRPCGLHIVPFGTHIGALDMRKWYCVIGMSPGNRHGIVIGPNEGGMSSP